MLRFDKIIHRLTMEEKVSLLVSNDSTKNNSIDDFKLPIFNLDDHHDISFGALAATWNLDLISKYAENEGLKLKTHKSPTIPMVNALDQIKYNANYFSTDTYCSGKFAGAYLKGLANADAIGALCPFGDNVDAGEEERRKNLLAAEVAIKEGKPFAVVADGTNNLDILLDEMKYKGHVIANTYEDKDIAKAFFNGCHFIFNENNPKEALINSINRYNTELARLQSSEITKVEFDELERHGEIFNPARLDSILDEFLGMLQEFDQKMCNFNSCSNPVSSDKDLAKEGIIMLQNKDEALPIDIKEPIAIIGAMAFEGGESSLVEYAKKLDLNVQCAAHGYAIEDLDEDELLEEALHLAEDVNTCVVYLSTNLNENTSLIPHNQLRVVQELKERGKKVIAIVAAPSALATSLWDYADAVLQLGYESKEAYRLTFDVLVGKFNPAGRIAWYNPIDTLTAIDPLDQNTYVHPFGYGLSFTLFEYSNIIVTPKGVSYTVKNCGAYDGSDLALMYIESKNNENEDTIRQIRGFNKIYLKSGESQRAYIDFDEFTFRSYNEELKSYEIKSGTYNVCIASSSESLKLITSVSLEGKVLNRRGFSNKIEEETDPIDVVLEKFQDTASKKSFFDEMRGIPYKWKMTIWVALFIYFNGMLIYMLSALSKRGGLGTIIPLAVLLLIFNAVAITLLVIMIKKKTKKVVTVSSDEISSFVKKLINYRDVAVVTYPKPVKPNPDLDVDDTDEILADDELEDDSDDLLLTDDDISDEPQIGYLESEFDKSSETVEFADEIFLDQYLTGFIDYSSNHGIIIEPKVCRSLMAALGTTHMIIATSPTRELLKPTFRIVSDYLASGNNCFDLTDVTTLNELLWERVNDDLYRKSEFNGYLANLRTLKKTINLAVLKNVDVDRLDSILGPIMNFVINPNGENYINLGTQDEEDLVLIPKNLIFVVIPKDDKYLETINPQLAERALCMDLQLRRNELEPVDAVDVKYMSYQELTTLVSENRERHIIPEEYWKKLDDLEEEINNLEPFRFENKTILDFEKFVGLMLESGADIDEAIDMLLASRVVPILKSYEIYKNNNGDNTLYEIIERIFTAENTELTKRAISKPLV